MSERWSDERIRAFWQTQALDHGSAPSASWSDVGVMDIEVRELTGRLPDDGRILDVGCANGWSTLQFAAGRSATIRGVDYIPEMIAHAESRLRSAPPEIRERVEFAVGDALDLAEETEGYDAVVAIRVIINLGSWERQLRAVRECARVLRRGGVLLLSEATVQGWQRLNALRREWGLEDIPMPAFNNYLDEERLAAAVSDELELVEVVNFASTYYVGTRLLKPLLVAAARAPVDPADPLSEWNRWLTSLPAWGDYGTQKLFVFRKPSGGR